jgi:hypothetical protein
MGIMTPGTIAVLDWRVHIGAGRSNFSEVMTLSAQFGLIRYQKRLLLRMMWLVAGQTIFSSRRMRVCHFGATENVTVAILAEH